MMNYYRRNLYEIINLENTDRSKTQVDFYPLVLFTLSLEFPAILHPRQSCTAPPPALAPRDKLFGHGVTLLPSLPLPSIWPPPRPQKTSVLNFINLCNGFLSISQAHSCIYAVTFLPGKSIALGFSGHQGRMLRMLTRLIRCHNIEQKEGSRGKVGVKKCLKETR